MILSVEEKTGSWSIDQHFWETQVLERSQGCICFVGCNAMFVTIDQDAIDTH